jgi:hypothetical protein
MGIYLLLAVVHLVIRATSQGKHVGTAGAEYYARAHNSLQIVTWCETALLDLTIALICTNICDTLYAEEKMNPWRRCINISFWILASTSALCHIIMVAVLCVNEDLSEITPVVSEFLDQVRNLTMLYGNIFIIIAHVRMHQVSLHPSPLA